MPSQVERWLETFMCQQYAGIFERWGYQTLDSVCQLGFGHLQSMGIAPGHHDIILEHISILKQTLNAGHNPHPTLPAPLPQPAPSSDPVAGPASSALMSVAMNAGAQQRGGQYGSPSPMPGVMPHMLPYASPAMMSGHHAYPPTGYQPGGNVYSDAMYGVQPPRAYPTVGNATSSQDGSYINGFPASMHHHMRPYLTPHQTPQSIADGIYHMTQTNYTQMPSVKFPNAMVRPPHYGSPIISHVPPVSHVPPMQPAMYWPQMHRSGTTSPVRSPASVHSIHSGHSSLKSPNPVSSPVNSVLRSPQTIQTSTVRSPLHQNSGSSIGSPASQSGTAPPSVVQQTHQKYHNMDSASGDLTSAVASASHANPFGTSTQGISSPLQSLQKLVMLPESRVVDPKSVVSDANLPSSFQEAESKNVQSGAGEPLASPRGSKDKPSSMPCNDGFSPELDSVAKIDPGQDETPACATPCISERAQSINLGRDSKEPVVGKSTSNNNDAGAVSKHLPSSSEQETLNGRNVLAENMELSGEEKAKNSQHVTTDTLADREDSNEHENGRSDNNHDTPQRGDGISKPGVRRARTKANMMERKRKMLASLTSERETAKPSNKIGKLGTAFSEQEDFIAEGCIAPNTDAIACDKMASSTKLDNKKVKKNSPKKSGITRVGKSSKLENVLYDFNIAVGEGGSVSPSQVNPPNKKKKKSGLGNGGDVTGVNDETGDSTNPAKKRTSPNKSRGRPKGSKSSTKKSDNTSGKDDLFHDGTGIKNVICNSSDESVAIDTSSDLFIPKKIGRTPAKQDKTNRTFDHSVDSIVGDGDEPAKKRKRLTSSERKRSQKSVASELHPNETDEDLPGDGPRFRFSSLKTYTKSPERTIPNRHDDRWETLVVEFDNIAGKSSDTRAPTSMDPPGLNASKGDISCPVSRANVLKKTGFLTELETDRYSSDSTTHNIVRLEQSTDFRPRCGKKDLVKLSKLARDRDRGTRTDDINKQALENAVASESVQLTHNRGNNEVLKSDGPRFCFSTLKTKTKSPGGTLVNNDNRWDKLVVEPEHESVRSNLDCVSTLENPYEGNNPSRGKLVNDIQQATNDPLLDVSMAASVPGEEKGSRKSANKLKKHRKSIEQVSVAQQSFEQPENSSLRAKKSKKSKVKVDENRDVRLGGECSSNIDAGELHETIGNSNPSKPQTASTPEHSNSVGGSPIKLLPGDIVKPESEYGPKKKRGRPFGSKNKTPKKTDSIDVTPSTVPKFKPTHQISLEHGSQERPNDKPKKNASKAPLAKPERIPAQCEKNTRKSAQGPFIRLKGKDSTDCVVYDYPGQEVNVGHKQRAFRGGMVVESESGRALLAKNAVVPSTRTHLSDTASNEWLCSLCGKNSQYKMLGDLFGPYYSEVSRSPNTPGRISESTDSDKRKKWRSWSKKASEFLQDCNELWVHEHCVIWTHGVYQIGSKIYGLEDAVALAENTICTCCHSKGASLGCLHKGCSQKYHYACAVTKDCHFDEEKFSLLCPKHKKKKMAC